MALAGDPQKRDELGYLGYLKGRVTHHRQQLEDFEDRVDKETLRQFRRGWSVKDIAAQFDLAESTMEKRIRELQKKWGKNPEDANYVYVTGRPGKEGVTRTTPRRDPAKIEARKQEKEAKKQAREEARRVKAEAKEKAKAEKGKTPKAKPEPKQEKPKAAKKPRKAKKMPPMALAGEVEFEEPTIDRNADLAKEIAEVEHEDDDVLEGIEPAEEWADFDADQQ